MLLTENDTLLSVCIPVEARGLSHDKVSYMLPTIHFHRVFTQRTDSLTN